MVYKIVLSYAWDTWTIAANLSRNCHDMSTTTIKQASLVNGPALQHEYAQAVQSTRTAP